MMTCVRDGVDPLEARPSGPGFYCIYMTKKIHAALLPALNLHQRRCLGRVSARRNRAGLRRSPVVDVADPVHAANGAVRRAAFGGHELPFYIGGGVVGERHARISALLGA